MKLNKKSFFKIHSWIGIRLSILFFIVCFSGTLATLSNEMDWLFNSEIRAVPQEELAPRNLIMENLKKTYPQAEVTFWDHSGEKYMCDILQVKNNGKRSYVFANPYTGEIQGKTQMTVQRYFRNLHYFLFIPFQIGHFTVLIFGFLLLISLITALVFYKKWWRKLFELKTGKGTLVFFRSLHRLVGVWSVPFTLLFSITGIWYFLERTNTAGLGRIANPRAPKIEALENLDSTENLDAKTLDYDKAIEIAKTQIPNLELGFIVPSRGSSGTIYITGTSEVPLVRPRANRVYLHPETYEVVSVQKATEIGAIMYLNDIADPLHFGYWGGLVTKIIWFILGLGISSLVGTGIWITLKRKAIKRKKNKQRIMGHWRYVNWGIFAVMLFFMYYISIDTYQVSTLGLCAISAGWAMFLSVVYYLFVYRLNNTVEKEIFKNQ
ncbi:PepSY-associated TM helix domain-containing protein [Maribacter sp. 2210JD10-5]|uniref:PepSY-associated TM helix domain-containing protein n=1 Tax=Maribacter sp. 2210JD10-5 TaxID=3386272 RepID=UPI0039BD7076